MVKNLEDALDEAVPFILEMVAKREKNPALTQPIIEEICELAVRLDVAYWDRVFPHRAGIHPKSRGRTGVDPFNAQNLVARISKVGFALKKLARERPREGWKIARCVYGKNLGGNGFSLKRLQNKRKK